MMKCAAGLSAVISLATLILLFMNHFMHGALPSIQVGPGRQLWLDDSGAMTYMRMTLVPESVWKLEMPNEKGPVFRADPIWRVPYGWVTTLALVLPSCQLLALLARRRRRARRIENGLCSGCGYDLRASSAKCPECGHVPADGKIPRDAEAGT